MGFNSGETRRPVQESRQRRLRPAVCAGLSVVLVMGAFTACAPRTIPSKPGFIVTTVQHDTTIAATIVPNEGMAVTQYATVSGTHQAPVSTVIVRFADATFIGIDYAKRTYVSSPLPRVIQAQRDNLAQALSTGPNGMPLGPHRGPLSTLAKLPLTTTIQGVSAQAYLLTVAGQQLRVWYATALPTPPAEMRKAMAVLEPSDADKHECDAVAENDVDHCKVNGLEVVGRVPLRVEAPSGSSWQVTLDAKGVQRIDVPASTFAPPPGFRSLPFRMPPPANRGAALLDTAAAALSRSAALNSTAAPSRPAIPPETVTSMAGAQIMADPRFYVFFWGAAFPGSSLRSFWHRRSNPDCSTRSMIHATRDRFFSTGFPDTEASPTTTSTPRTHRSPSESAAPLTPRTTPARHG